MNLMGPGAVLVVSCVLWGRRRSAAIGDDDEITCNCVSKVNSFSKAAIEAPNAMSPFPIQKITIHFPVGYLIDCVSLHSEPPIEVRHDPYRIRNRMRRKTVLSQHRLIGIHV